MIRHPAVGFHERTYQLWSTPALEAELARAARNMRLNKNARIFGHEFTAARNVLRSRRQLYRELYLTGAMPSPSRFPL